MGIGRLNADRFDLLVSFRHDADATRIEEWRASFEQASRLLFEATGGRHQFGAIRVSNASAGSRDADAWLLEDEGQSSSPPLGLGTAGAHMTLHGDERFKPFVIVRHFAQYAYGLYDEWIGPGDLPAVCIDDEESDACIMQATWAEGDRFGADGKGGALVPGRVRSFCTNENHDPDGDTLQQSVHGESCWDTMVSAFPELGAPPPVGATFSGIDWITQAPDQRFVVVIDRSGSMADDGKLNEAQIGAHWWVDASRAEDQLGLVSFADDATVDFGLTAMSDSGQKAVAHDCVSSLSAGGNTAIGDGLRAALETITSPGTRATTQAVILVTDGIHNAGEDPEAVLVDLVDAGVRVYTVGVGISVGTALLQRIAEATGGAFSRINTTQPGAKQAKEMRDELARISALARNNGGILASLAAPLQEGEEHLARTIEIEEGSDVVTFLVSWPDPNLPLELALRSPEGNLITADGQVTEIRGEFPYMAFVVDRPAPGPWEVEITAVSSALTIDAQLMAFSEHPRIDGTLTVGRSQYQPGDIVPVFLQTYCDQPLTKLKVGGVVRLPDGSRAPLRFDDVAGLPTGDVVARDGLYSARFDETHEASGTYVFDVAVESTDQTAPARGGEPALPGEVFDAPSIPGFRRRFTTAVVIGDEHIEGGED